MVDPLVSSVSGTSEKSILLVEDNMDDVIITQHVWKRSKMDANLYVVYDGECAIHFVNKQRDFEKAPDVNLMLLDLKLPRVDGFEVLKTLKKDYQKRVFPIIVMLSVMNEEVIKKIKDYGCDSFIEKPLTVEKLCEVDTLRA